MKLFLSMYCLVLAAKCAHSQVIPPVMGGGKTGSWMAFSIRQDLDAVKGKGWQSITYIGAGRTSNPDNYNPFYKPGTITMSQEFKNRFREDWDYSLSVSYSRQHEYSDIPPYEKNDPDMKQSFRLFGRLSYIIQTSFVEISPAIREDVQKYFAPGFKKYREDLRLRSRFRIKFDFPLVPDKSHRILLFSEQIFSTSRMNQPSGDWTSFKYKDSRFSLYYSLSPKGMPLTFNLGYMNDLINSGSPISASYFAMDVAWKNPFTKKQ